MSMTSAERQRKYRERHKGDGTLWKPNPDKVAGYRKAVKLKVLTHYGAEKCACVMCGESRIDCLSLDHKNGGGNADRKLTNRHGHIFYSYLIRNGYPEGYQTLCMNCQWIKRFSQKEYNHLFKVNLEK